MTDRRRGWGCASGGRSRLRVRLLAIVGTVVAASLLALVIYRVHLMVFASNNPIVSPNRDWSIISRGDETLFWGLKPNLHAVHFSGVVKRPNGEEYPIAFTVSTNDRGLRSGPIGEKGGRFRILAVGDSTTFCDWVDDEQTWPSQLQALLDPDGDAIEVINAGVPGYTAYQGLRYLEGFGLALDPDLVIATFGHNDDKRWDGISDYERAAARASSADGLARLVRQPNAPEYAPGEGRPRLTEQEFVDTLIAMKRLCDSREIVLVLLAWPMTCDLLPGKQSYIHLIYETGRRTGMPVVDLLRPARRHLDVFIDACHFNAEGCRLVAETVADHLLTGGFVKTGG